MNDCDPVSAFTRPVQLDRLTAGERYDLLVVGGGATGAGIALDAASRGYRVALCEQHDFGKGTSSRSTKLVHGGVRYLEQGNVRLVRDALRERGLLLQNAPHVCYRLPTVVPLYRWWEPVYYRTGLAMYDALAGRLGLGRSRLLSRDATVAELPTIQAADLRGGVRYYDGGFDDTRLLTNLMQAAVQHGAVCVNYARVKAFVNEGGRVVGVQVVDGESGAEHTVHARVVVNAAGPFGDTVRSLADADAPAWIQPSQGTHIVLDRGFLPTESALIVPKTTDGRVVFAIPWHGYTLVGTTDRELDEIHLEPRPRAEEIEFLLETVGRYLTQRPRREDVRSVFAGLRPLVRADAGAATSKLSRDHSVRVEPSGLVTVLGGKWTTYRKMAEDAVDRCVAIAGLPKQPCRTATLPIRSASSSATSDRLAGYGADADALRNLLASKSSLAEPLVDGSPYSVGEAVWAIRHEMARSIEDVLSRRLRMLLLDARAAIAASERVARLLASELGRNDEWVADETQRFHKLAAGYQVDGALSDVANSAH